MAFTFLETPESRSQDYSAQDGNVTLIYKAVGEQDDAVVRDYAPTGSPLTVTGLNSTLYRKSISIRPDGWQQYTVEVAYGRLTGNALPRGSFTFSFDTTGKTTNVKVGEAHVKSYPTDGNIHKGAIGVLDGKVDGVDILIPGLKLNFAFKYPRGDVSIERVKAIARATGKYNKYRFLSFEPGELLFIGASGEDGTDSELTVNFAFEASENATNFTSAGIEHIDKLGHDYIWWEFAEETFDGKPCVNAFAAHIEQIYLPTDFDAAFGWNIYTRG